MLIDVMNDKSSALETSVEKRMTEISALNMRLNVAEMKFCVTPDLVRSLENVDGSDQKATESTKTADEKPEPIQAIEPIFTGKDIETMAKGVEALKQWTGKSTATFIYDSNIDDFTFEAFFNKVQKKRNVAVVGFTFYGDVFGGCYSVGARTQDDCFWDPNMFIFSFESHGRCQTPKRFDVQSDSRGDAKVRLRDGGFIKFLVYRDYEKYMSLGNERSYSCCQSLWRGFDNIDNTTLSGNENRFQCTRIVAIHLS